MHWERLFEDLEGQLAAEWESERVALDAESERLRISRLDLRGRLRALCAARGVASIDLAGGARVRARFHVLGADWLAAAMIEAEGVSVPRTTRIIPLRSIRGMSVDHGLLLASLEDSGSAAPDLRERMTLGFVLRDLARRRVAVRILGLDGTDLHGTIDRAGADHLDLALHDPGRARVAGAVHGFRIVPFSAVVSVQASGDQMP